MGIPRVAIQAIRWSLDGERANDDDRDAVSDTASVIPHRISAKHLVKLYGISPISTSVDYQHSALPALPGTRTNPPSSSLPPDIFHIRRLPALSTTSTPDQPVPTPHPPDIFSFPSTTSTQHYQHSSHKNEYLPPGMTPPTHKA